MNAPSGFCSVVTTEGRGWPRPEKTALILLAAFMLLSLCLLVHPWYDARNDASIYIITARAMADGRGYDYLGLPFRVRPPGFSAMIVPILKGFGTNFFALNLLVGLLGAGGVLLLFLLQRPRVGWVLSSLTAAAVWLNPGYRRMCNRVMSDVPGLALLLACLLIERWASRNPSWKREIFLGASIGAAVYVRTSILLLVPAILVARVMARLRHSGPGPTWGTFVIRRLATFTFVVWLVGLPWSVRNARSAPPAPVDQTMNYSTWTAMWHRDPGDPASPRLAATEILARLRANVGPISSVLGSRMREQKNPGKPPIAGAGVLEVCVSLILVSCLLIVLWRRRSPAEIYAAGLLVPLLFYFTVIDRLLLPVYVIAFAAFVDVLDRLLRRLAGARAAAVFAPAVVFLLIAVDFDPRPDWSRIEERHHAYAEIASAVKAGLQPGARLASAQGFHYEVYLERPVYSLSFAIRRGKRNDAAEEIIDKYGIEAVVLSPLDVGYATIARYFRQRYGTGQQMRAATVWRVRPPRDSASSSRDRYQE